jgi:hypothetical protein
MTNISVELFDLKLPTGQTKHPTQTEIKILVFQIDFVGIEEAQPDRMTDQTGISIPEKKSS